MRFPHKAERVTYHKVVAPTKFDMMSYNNNAGIPVGFRFHPTDEELVGFYLNGRISTPPPDPREEDLRIIRELDLYRHEPWDLSEVCKIPGDHSVNQNNWYFFSHKDKKYPTGNRANRATKAGFWKATGRDKCIQTRYAVGMRKTLVFYRGRAPHGQKTDWIMHEFRLDDGTAGPQHSSPPSHRTTAHPSFDYVHEGAGAWVVCRVFRKTKNVKSKDNSVDTPTTSLEEDHQVSLLPDITDSTEKFSSDEGEHVDYPPADHLVQHHFNSSYTNIQQQQQQQQQQLVQPIQQQQQQLQSIQQPQQQLCKQEHLMVADYTHMEQGTMLPLQASMFRAQQTVSNYNTFQIQDGSVANFDHQMQMSGASSSSAAGLFSPVPNVPYLAMMQEPVAQGPGDIRGLAQSYTRAGPAMFEGLDDFTRFSSAPVSFPDQSLTDVVAPRSQQQQLQQPSELLSSASHHDLLSFPTIPAWQGTNRSGIGAPQSQQFVDFSDSINTSYLSSLD